MPLGIFAIATKAVTSSRRDMSEPKNHSARAAISCSIVGNARPLAYASAFFHSAGLIAALCAPVLLAHVQHAKVGLAQRVAQHARHVRTHVDFLGSPGQSHAGFISAQTLGSFQSSLSGSE